MLLALPFLALLAVATATSVLGCCVPLAGLAAAAAMNLSRRSGAALSLAVWFSNQVVGFTVHAYPRTLSTFTWGVALGAATFAAYSIARAFRRNLFAAFGGAFIAFEFVLVGFSFWLGGWGAYAPGLVLEILAINAAWFAAAHVTLRLVANQPIFSTVSE